LTRVGCQNQKKITLGLMKNDDQVFGVEAVGIPQITDLL